FPALPRGLLVDLPRQIVEKWILDNLLIKRRILSPAVLPWIVDKKLALRDAGGAERVGLDDVGPSLEEPAVNIAGHFRLGQREEVPVVHQALGRVLKPVAANVRFLHAVGADGRTHRAVDDRDSRFEQLLQWMWMGRSHVR